MMERVIDFFPRAWLDSYQLVDDAATMWEAWEDYPHVDAIIDCLRASTRYKHTIAEHGIKLLRFYPRIGGDYIELVFLLGQLLGMHAYLYPDHYDIRFYDRIVHMAKSFELSAQLPCGVVAPMPSVTTLYLALWVRDHKRDYEQYPSKHASE